MRAGKWKNAITGEKIPEGKPLFVLGPRKEVFALIEHRFVRVSKMTEEEIKGWEWRQILSRQITSLEKVVELNLKERKATIVVNLNRVGERVARALAGKGTDAR